MVVVLGWVGGGGGGGGWGVGVISVTTRAIFVRILDSNVAKSLCYLMQAELKDKHHRSVYMKYAIQ